MPTVLLVDDEAALTRVLKEGLEFNLEDTKVHAAATFEDAMAVAEGLDSLECLIVDYHLGERTGIELCTALGERFDTMQTLVYTGKATAQVEAEAEACSARVLWKPQRLKSVVAAVKQCLAAAAG